MKRVSVVTQNPYLWQKIKLTLENVADVSLDNDFVTCDICLWDTDTCGKAPASAITMSKARNSTLPLPFSYDALLSLIKSDNALISLDESGRICSLREKRIKLTELEGALLSLLLSAKGEFVSRDRILKEIWGDGADAGIINVYIHYLREKLEDGEKIILASRGEGYRIDKRFLGGGPNA